MSASTPIRAADSAVTPATYTASLLEHDGRLLHARVYRRSQRRMLLVFAGIGLITMFGLALALAPEILASPGYDPGRIRMVGIACVVLFGGLLLANARIRRHGEPVLALTPAGIHEGSARTRGDGALVMAISVFVPWPAIAAVEPARMNGVPVIRLDIRDPGAVRVVGGTRRGYAMRQGRGLLGTDVFVGGAVQGAPLAPIAEVMGRCIADPASVTTILGGRSLDVTA